MKTVVLYVLILGLGDVRGKILNIEDARKATIWNIMIDERRTASTCWPDQVIKFANLGRRVGPGPFTV